MCVNQEINIEIRKKYSNFHEDDLIWNDEMEFIFAVSDPTGVLIHELNKKIQKKTHYNDNQYATPFLYRITINSGYIL